MEVNSPLRLRTLSRCWWWKIVGADVMRLKRNTFAYLFNEECSRNTVHGAMEGSMQPLLSWALVRWGHRTEIEKCRMLVLSWGSFTCSRSTSEGVYGRLSLEPKRSSRENDINSDCSSRWELSRQTGGRKMFQAHSMQMLRAVSVPHGRGIYKGEIRGWRVYGD